MILIVVGEEFKQIDRKTGGQFFNRYPQAIEALRKIIQDLQHGAG